MNNTYQIGLIDSDISCIERHIKAEAPALPFTGMREAAYFVQGGLGFKAIKEHKRVVEAELLGLLHIIRLIVERNKHTSHIRLENIGLNIQKQACEQGLVAWHFVLLQSENFGVI